MPLSAAPWHVLLGASLILAGCRQISAGPQIPAAAAVGRLGSADRWITPTNQILSPAGKQTALPRVRPQAIALSPNGAVLAVSGVTDELILLDPVSGSIRQRVSLPPAGAGQASRNDTDLLSSKEDKLSLTGLAFAPDGSRLYLANANGDIKVFAIAATGRAAALRSIGLPPANARKRKEEIPAGMVVSADGRSLYVAANLTNRLLEIGTDDGQVRRSWDVGVAPLDVALAAGKAYVSNEGGRRPGPGDVTGPAGRGTEVRVDSRSIPDEGSVSVIDLRAGGATKELQVGPHASGLAVSPDGRYVVVACAGSDTLQVIDTRTDTLVEKIWARQTPADLYGAQPCALGFSAAGDTLYVCNSAQNAVAVIDFEPAKNASRVTGLIPTGWYPLSIAVDRARGRLCVANLKGIGAFREFAPGEPVRFRSRDYYGTVSLITIPGRRELAAWTHTALFNARFPRLKEAALPPRPAQPPRPVPERVGEPSVFHHVIYIIKENRSYDQMLGDMKEGNGDPSLCTFGEAITPNQHAIARQFVLLDNTHCSGVQSADGHQWTDSGFANDYVERELTSAYPRSYPGSKGDPDALAYASSGFIWDDALAHGRTFRNYGEWLNSAAGWSDPKRHGQPASRDFWNDLARGTRLTRVAGTAAIAAMAAHSKLDTIGWDLRVPDQVRANRFIDELHRFEAHGGMPDFCLVYLPNNHTGALQAGLPTPRAAVADNDLALGRIVEAVSHSRFWADTCIFSIEDDPQSGWDHVSGYRTACFVASAYTKRRQTVSAQYNQLSVLRTMELMMGLPPMNQLDAAAVPMSGCFNPVPDLAPYVAEPNRVPLAEFNPPPSAIADPRQRRAARESLRLPLNQPDLCDDDQLNRILWQAMKGSAAAYPAWAVKATDDD